VARLAHILAGAWRIRRRFIARVFGLIGFLHYGSPSGLTLAAALPKQQPSRKWVVQPVKDSVPINPICFFIFI
jgi:hypothetical protein